MELGCRVIREGGPKVSRPLLAKWCEQQLKGEVVLLEPEDRLVVEEVSKTL